MSLGRAWVHDLPNKLGQAAACGFEGVELFYEDLEYFARELFPDAEDVASSQVAAAFKVKEICDRLGLQIIALQPFMHYEGLLSAEEHASRIQRLKVWFRVAKVVGTTTILIPSNFLPASQLSPDLRAHVADLIEAADLGAKQSPPIRFAYEALAWGTLVDTWEVCWWIVHQVNRPNFGMCLDTFQIAGRVFADPASPCGTTGPDALLNLRKSLGDMVNTIEPDKVFFVQLVSGERLEEPIRPGHKYYAPDQPPRMSWSRNCRLFYGEADRGDYLPVQEVAAAIFSKSSGLGFEGWVSMELFSRTLAEPGQDVPAQHARRGIESWKRLASDFGLLKAPIPACVARPKEGIVQKPVINVVA